MGNPRRFVALGVLLVFLVYGATLGEGAPRHKRQAQAFLTWFYQNFPWYARRSRMAAGQRSATTSTSNAASQGPLRQPPSTVGTQQRPSNSPVRAYNSPGVKVRGPLVPHVRAPNRATFNNRGPLINNRGPLIANRRPQIARAGVGLNPGADPADPPEIVNGMIVTDPPEVPEPPDPTDPPEMPLFPGFPGMRNSMMAQGPFAGYRIPGQVGLGMIPVEVTDPPDMTDPPDFAELGLLGTAAPVTQPTTTVEPPTVAAVTIPTTTAYDVVEQATPWFMTQNMNSLGSIPTQAVRRNHTPIFQQAPPFVLGPPTKAPPPKPVMVSYKQAAVNLLGKSAGTTPKQAVTKSAKPAPAPAPPNANRPSWGMGGNFSNMRPWRRMMWNRYFFNYV